MDPAAQDNFSIRWSSQEGRVEGKSLCVRLLLEDRRVAKPVDPAADDYFATRIASAYGHVEVGRLLLQN